MMMSKVWLLVLLGGASAGCPHCTPVGPPPPSAILEMPPPPRLPSFPTWTVCGGQQRASLNGSAKSAGWWLTGPSSGVDKAWPLAVVLVAGSATVLGSVLLLVLSKKKRWQPGRSSPGHHAGLPAALLLPSKGILVGASLAAAGAYDNSAFAENVAVTGGGPPRTSLLRQLQPPSLGGYRQLPHHHGPLH